jgi:hypothetical protein
MNYWDKVVDQCKASNTDYGNWINTSYPQDVNDRIRSGDRENAYGKPTPTSFADAMARNTFLNLPLYNNAYEQIKPYLEGLAKASAAIIEDPVMKPNDLELGVFSIDRAMMAIEATPSFYSKKHDKYYYPDQVEDYKDKKTGETLYRLHEDKSPVELVQLEEDGSKVWYTNNKKSFLYKTNVERPANAVRLFVTIGNNWGQDPYWAGLAGVIIAQYLESKGYKVCITCCVVVVNHGCKLPNGTLGDAFRINMFNLKNYNETYDSESILYPLADASFFRVRVFLYYMAQQWKYGDTYSEGLGYTPDSNSFKKVLDEQIKLRNFEKEKDVLYYHIGGREINNIDQCIDKIKEIVLQAEEANKELLQRIRLLQSTKII